MKVKFCGITNLEDAWDAVRLGVDALGFIFYPKSPRYISIGEAAKIAGSMPPYLSRVAVTVNALDDEIARIDAAGVFDCIQLHGEETPERCRELHPRRLVKAIGLPLGEAGGKVPGMYPVSGLLVDKASVKRGGTGESVDWNQAAALRVSSEVPVILSGGLTPDNVRKAVKIVQPYGIDVCSGIEREPGRKDHQKMQEFISQCQR